MNRRIWIAAAWAFIATNSISAAEIRVAAAADLKFAMDELIHTYETAHPDRKVSAIIGASGSLVAQIEQGAPFDLFYSADHQYAEKLVKDGKAAGKEFAYALGHLALWVPQASKIDLAQGIAVLSSPDIHKIAIANPEHAPYGRAAREAIRKAGLDAAVSGRLVMGENVAQTAQFVETGAADVGLIALSLARSAALAGKGRFVEVDPALYSKMTQYGVVLKDGAAARDFRDFVASGAGDNILERFGLTPTGH